MFAGGCLVIEDDVEEEEIVKEEESCLKYSMPTSNDCTNRRKVQSCEQAEGAIAIMRKRSLLCCKSNTFEGWKRTKMKASSDCSNRSCFAPGQ